MSVNKLEIIPINDIPNCGGEALERRGGRRVEHATLTGCFGFTGILSTGMAVLIGLIPFSNPSYFWKWWFFPLLVAFPVLAIMGVASLGCAAEECKKFFREGNPQYCLPENSSIAQANEEQKMRKAIGEYNTLAQEWNAGESEDCEDERETHRQLLNAHRANLCEWMRAFHVRISRASLPAPEPEPSPRPRVHPGHGLLGPSRLYK